MIEILENQHVRVQRTKCPLYGFFDAFGCFMDQGGNQCPLKDGYSPCLFVYRQQEPNWQECSFNIRNPGLLNKLKDSRVFPNELKPEGAVSWDGVRFGDWADYIL